MDVPTDEERAATRAVLDHPFFRKIGEEVRAHLATEEGREAQERYSRDHPCVGSGWCCKKVPCPYGVVDVRTGWCAHLAPWPGDDLGVPRYRCGRYEYIRTQPDADLVPAFGGGCSSPLFNSARDRVLVALGRKPSGVPSDGTLHLRLVLVLTALRNFGRPATLAELAGAAEGERDDVGALVDELVRRGKVVRDGDGLRCA